MNNPAAAAAATYLDILGKKSGAIVLNSHIIIY